ncbi:MAG: 8-oxo-dGTP diphosphatase [Frankiales bacterium]|jgi:8-oxo-dGTP diphosphatase|nr:8-oxo-dGTP diphosphatase [Frankiales bacterium]
MTTEPVVVGAAIVRDGRLLVAQRAYPEELAGRWELPGGKVEPEETEVAALIRECREELGVDVVVGERVGRDHAIGGGFLLRLYAATTTGDPVAHEHQSLAWVGAAELDTVAWLPGDRPLVPALVALLAGGTHSH